MFRTPNPVPNLYSEISARLIQPLQAAFPDLNLNPALAALQQNGAPGDIYQAVIHALTAYIKYWADQKEAEKKKLADELASQKKQLAEALKAIDERKELINKLEGNLNKSTDQVRRLRETVERQRRHLARIYLQLSDLLGRDSRTHS